MIKTAELQRSTAYKRILTLIETAQTVQELLDGYFTEQNQNEMLLMKTELVREIETRYLNRKEKLSGKAIR